VVSVQYPLSSVSSQELSGRRRQCLLKGCERWFWPSRPQARYCGEGCRAKARRWRRWRGSRKYRASAGGRACRRQQAQRYRQRQRNSSSGASSPDPADVALLPQASGGSVEPPHASGPTSIEPSQASGAGAEPVSPTATPADVAGASQPEREGQRAAFFCGEAEGRPCDRPGCYCLFVPGKCAPAQRFCSVSCRRALRRVLDREARWRQRRRRGAQERRWGTARPP
jgi:hypothetical protein